MKHRRWQDDEEKRRHHLIKQAEAYAKRDARPITLAPIKFGEKKDPKKGEKDND